MAEYREAWQVAAKDQMHAALEKSDGLAFAKTLVDSQLRGLRLDFGDEPINFAAVLDILNNTASDVVALCAAECLRRLHERSHD